MSVPFIFCNGTLNLILGGRSYQLTPEHPSYGLVKAALKTATESELLELCDVQKSMQVFVEKESKGRAVVSNGQVFFDGKIVHSNLATRILQFMQNGLPFKHLLLFMENLSLNPSFNSQNELFDFLENKSLPITEEGEVLCYKAIREDWMDKYTGKISNKIGNIIEVPRGDVDDDRNNECSSGLHCGALDYVYSYGNGTDRIVIVKVNPRDAVSVPKDCSFQKLRVCRYEVVGEFIKEMKAPLYTAKAEEVQSPINDSSYDWSWADRGNSDDGYDADGYDQYGYDEEGYDEDGYDDCGYDRDGFDCYGCDEEGYDEDGYDCNGYDEDGYDEDGYDCDGFDRNGNEEGCDCDDDDYTGGVTVNSQRVDLGAKTSLGVKPSGQHFYNKRDSYGRFC